MDTTNAVLELMRNRKSVRAYADKPVDRATINTLVAAALEAPSAGNMCLWSVLNITDPAIKERLSVTCDNQPFIATAPAVLVFCVDYERWYQQFCRNAEQVGETTRKPGAGDFLLAFEDTMIAAQSAVLAAESLGLGSCYIGDILENYETHQELLKLPQYVIPVSLICFGYPTEQQKSRKKPARFTVDEVMCENTYSPTFPAEFKDALARRQNKTDETFEPWLTKFRTRKWDSEFSREMTRSCEAILKSWYQ